MATAEGARDKGSGGSQDMLGYGRQVIAAEASGLEALAAALDGSFTRAVDLLLDLRGRVVTTGIGKSGHVARKVTATLASTGTPSLYVHPSEAAHGDLGMMVAGDALIAFSNSGETSELQPLVARAAKLGVVVVGVTSRRESLLMRQSDIGLLLPPVPEACPDGLAPTSSTAMMMALGDALALAVSRGRGRSRASFEELHPGGAIGKRLMRVAAVMHRGDMPIVAADSQMRDVIVTITGGSFGIAGVVDARGALVGVITDGDLRRHLDTLFVATAGEVMTPNPICIEPGAMIEDALALLNRYKITAMFAVEAGGRMPVGIVHVHDFLRLGLA